MTDDVFAQIHVLQDVQTAARILNVLGRPSKWRKGWQPGWLVIDLVQATGLAVDEVERHLVALSRASMVKPASFGPVHWTINRTRARC